MNFGQTKTKLSLSPTSDKSPKNLSAVIQWVRQQPPLAPLGANQRKRAKYFYHPLLFLDSVQDCCQHAVARKVADAPQNPNQGSEADFCTLVNKLGRAETP